MSDPSPQPGADPDPNALAEPETADSCGITDERANNQPKRASGFRGALSRIPHPNLRTRRGLFVGFALAVGFTAAAFVVGMEVVHYSESTEFCTTCHTMIPEEKAHEAGAHRNVECASCHVEPGVMGFVEAKLAGTQELYHLVTNSYPTPIHAHRDRLPTVQGTCMQCHPLGELTAAAPSMQLILRPDYKSDKANTAGTTALALKADAAKRVHGGDSTAVGGVHWHVTQNMRYVVSDDPNSEIDLVEWTDPEGKVHTYLGTPKMGLANNVAPDLAKLTTNAKWQGFNCIDCHNRVGHETPTVDAALDQAMSSGAISPKLPYVKRQGTVLLNAAYDSQEQAAETIGKLPRWYATRYPLVAKSADSQIDQAVGALTAAQAQLSTPEMKVTPRTYANNLGHQASPGCFRCHDGAHFEVVDNKTTKRTISSNCATCHTFPQTGQVVSELPVGAEPPTHADSLWVFYHKNRVSSDNPEGTECGSCHTRNYCSNCHDSGAAKVSHDEMMYNHAASIRKSGLGACAECHQPYMCTTCHAGDPLRTGKTGDAKSKPTADNAAGSSNAEAYDLRQPGQAASR